MWATTDSSRTVDVDARAGNAAVASPTLGKRKADDHSLNDSERFAKRFNLLSLGINHAGENSKFYVPVASAQNTLDSIPPATLSAQLRRAEIKTDANNDSMLLDDTRHRVFIHNLDEELAEEEPQEERLIFLPDIEKRFSRMPHQILESRRDEGHENQELVLYTVPKSLTVDERHDSVRKAILEARHRAREKALEEARQLDMNRKYDHSTIVSTPLHVETAHGYSSGYDADGEEVDEDAMDMD